MSNDLRDEEIAVRVQSGDTDAYGILIERYEKKLLRYGTKFLSRTEDMEDVVQDVFLSVYQNIQSFDPSQKFSSWIYRIAHNSFVNSLKKTGYLPRTFFDFDTLFAHTAYDDPSHEERERAELKQLVERGLAELNPKYREILTLFYFEELGYREIADVLAVPIGTVSVRVKRAKEALRAVYDKMNLPYGK